MAVNLFQAIWEADENNRAQVDWPSAPPFPAFPSQLGGTYQAVKSLFDNYNRKQYIPEDKTPEEIAEEDNLIDLVVASNCMKVVQTKMELSPAEMKVHLKELWFTFFDLSSSRDLSFFEHIVVGEIKDGKVSGQHFWYSWLLFYHDIPLTHDSNSNSISYHSTYRKTDEVLTAKYDWWINAQRFKKGTGGFFLNCSIECLMAICTLRYYLGPGDEHMPITLNNRNYDLVLYVNNGHPRSVFPMIIQ